MGVTERGSVAELLAADAARECVVRERWARDTGAWDVMADCYFDDTKIAIGWATCSGAEFIEKTKDVASSPRGQGVHQLGPMQVDVAGDRAVAELPGNIVMPVQVDGYELLLLVWERMAFRVEKREDDWRIAEFRAIYLKDTFMPYYIGDKVELDVAKLEQCRKSYRHTQYWSIQAGWGNHPDRPGLDRPDLMDAVYRDNRNWLNGAA